jgi:hypothetical protein
MTTYLPTGQCELLKTTLDRRQPAVNLFYC